jgi:uncharacterized membrane protein YedE/YeeE
VTEFELDLGIAVLGLIALAVMLGLARRWRSKTSPIDLDDLLMENGRTSKIAVGYMALLVFSIWLMTYLAFDDKMTEGYFTIFCATWVAPIIARIMKGNGYVAADAPKE